MTAPRVLLLVIAALCGRCWADGRLDVAARAAQLADCFEASAVRRGVDAALLRAIAQVESGFRPQATNRNSDGTIDFGVMQVNSSHLKRLQHHGIDGVQLLQQPCLNVDVGAWILADSIRQFGPTWRAVGAYGAGNAATKEQARSSYAAKVHRALVAWRSDGDREHAAPPRDVSSRAVRAMQVIE